MGDMKEMEDVTRMPSPVASKVRGTIDHIAVAVPDLEASIEYYTGVLGFKLRNRLETQGEYTGMYSAVVDAGGFYIVLLQGKEPASQVSRFIAQHGPGVQHVAFAVDAIEDVHRELLAKGQQFVTGIIDGPGLRQLFTKRDAISGLMIEYIERSSNPAFADQNVQELFKQMERADAV